MLRIPDLADTPGVGRERAVHTRGIRRLRLEPCGEVLGEKDTFQQLSTDAAEVGLELASVDAYVIEALDALRAAKLRGDFKTIESAIQIRRKK